MLARLKDDTTKKWLIIGLGGESYTMVYLASTKTQIFREIRHYKELQVFVRDMSLGPPKWVDMEDALAHYSDNYPDRE